MDCRAVLSITKGETLPSLSEGWNLPGLLGWQLQLCTGELEVQALLATPPEIRINNKGCAILKSYHILEVI